MNKYLCIYHSNCSDGFGAAYAFNEWTLENGITDVTYLPTHYGDPIPEVTGMHVYILDFSYDRETLLQMEKEAASLLVIDHHKSAERQLNGLEFCIFDMNRSGAVLTWDVLMNGNHSRPMLLDYIQDRDLWQWKLPGSREVSAALRSYPMRFDVWDDFMDYEGIKRLMDEGKAILRYIQQQVEEIVTNPEAVDMEEIGGYRVPVVNTRQHISEIGNELAHRFQCPFAATYFIQNGQRYYSLRSAETGLDVSVIAKMYGGGGHRHAAGFNIPVDASLALET
jgi:oligoribonuclease NrnB/cAMP/cGMP phosphodiesterase (DHH superfamily)